MTLNSIPEAKSQAKALRDALAGQGTSISHAQALELVAHQNGARDWNTLHAKLSRAEPQSLQLNDQVRGQYLGQAFTGRIVALSKIGSNLNISIQLDVPIDTVRFEGFSNMRRRIRGVIGPDGQSLQKTSDGVPQLVIDMPGRTLGSS
jgi:hypothetical protein